MVMLETLSLSDNFISLCPVPRERLCTKLRVLDLERNALTSADGLVGLVSLDTLKLSHNRLDVLSPSLSALSNLVWLCIVLRSRTLTTRANTFSKRCNCNTMLCAM